jgi:hydroxylaminobenzene mutase
MTIQQNLARAGAWLFFIGLLTGLWAGAVLTNVVNVPMPRVALVAHLNALLGGLWCIAVSATMPHLSYGEAGRRRLALLVAGATWANWGITVLASILGVRGLEYGGSTANSVVAGMLQAFVVVPALIGAGAWAWGFRPKKI